MATNYLGNIRAGIRDYINDLLVSASALVVNTLSSMSAHARRAESTVTREFFFRFADASPARYAAGERG